MDAGPTIDAQHTKGPYFYCPQPPPVTLSTQEISSPETKGSAHSLEVGHLKDGHSDEIALRSTWPVGQAGCEEPVWKGLHWWIC